MLPTTIASPTCTHCKHPKVVAPAPQPVVVQQTIAGTYSSVTRVEIRGVGSEVSLGGSEGVDAYKAVQSTADAANPFAKSILTFIGAQIGRDVAAGATQEELTSRLQAGLKGFEEGYGDAFQQLSASGMLTEELRSEIETTRTQVLAGIQKMASDLGIELQLPSADSQPQAANSSLVPTVNTGLASPQANPVNPSVNPGKELLTAALRDVQIIEQYQQSIKSETTYQNLGRKYNAAQSYAYGVRESRDFSLKLRTNDGDAVTIRMSADRSGQAQFSYGQSPQGAAASLSRSASQSAGFQFTVEGELDEDELRALTELLHQVGNISEEFFQGDLDGAFQLATELSYDSNEIASFDLKLHMSSTEVAQSAYQRDAKPSDERRSPYLGGFVESVMRAGDLAEKLGQRRSLVADLLDWVSQSQPQRPQGQFLGPAARAML